jgi:hypothetical protein
MLREIQIGGIIRLLLTGILLVSSKNYRLKIILIFLTDFFDCWSSRLVALFTKETRDMCKSYNYQFMDKVIDLLTYFMVYVYFGLNPIYFYIIIIRLIGILMFYKTMNSRWLVLFPDVFKEILLYDWFIAKLNLTNFSMIFICKTIFEYIWHNYVNPNNYKKMH